MDKQYLDGAVTIHTLARHEVGALNGHVTDGRISMPAGELSVVLNGPTVRYVATVEFIPAVPRGNHVHHRKVQWLYLISGRLEAIVKDMQSQVGETFTMEPGDLVTVQPNIAHVFTATVPSLALEACAEAYDPADTFPYPLVPTS